MKKVLLILFAFTTLVYTGTINANETELGTSASVVSISDNSNPYVVGQAYGTDVVGFSIVGQFGDKIYGSGDIEVNNNSWSHEILTDLTSGGYDLVLYVDNIEYDRIGFNVKLDGSNYRDLDLSVTPDEVEEGNDITIRFNDIGAVHYTLFASCKDGINFSGKARPDLCRDSERINPTGKDAILVRGFYPSALRDTSVRLHVRAFNKSGEVVAEDNEDILIDVAESYKEDDDFAYMFEKYGDIKFKTPEEGSKEGVGSYEAGETIKLKWENVVKADWDINLYKHDSNVSRDILKNGFKDGTMGTQISVNSLAFVRSDTENVKIKLPDLEAGYYYFGFSGKAAGDNSPAIRIVTEDGKYQEEVDDSYETVVYNSREGQIEELMKILIKLLTQLMELQARGQ